MLFGQSKGSGQPWSKTPSSQKFWPASNGPQRTKSTSKPVPTGFPSSSNAVFCVIWISMSPESPICIVFQDGFGVVYRQAICPILG